MKANETLQMLEQGISDFKSSDKWQEYLSICARNQEAA